MRDELITKLQNHNTLTEDECFEVANDISRLLNSTEESLKQNGRNFIIRLLDNWNNISESYRTIFIDLISAAGFYPYLKKLEITNQDLGDEIRFEHHKSHYLPNKYFHSEQKRLADLIERQVNVIVSAPRVLEKVC